MADRTVVTRLKAEMGQYERDLARAVVVTKAVGHALNSLDNDGPDRASLRVRKLGDSAVRADRSINQLTGRLRLMGDAVAILGPGVVSIGALAVPAVAGLSAQLSAAALAAGVLVVTFQGMGDALKAVEKADLEPTAENLAAAEAAVAKLAPAAQNAVGQIRALKSELADQKFVGQEAFFPGFNKAVDSLLSRGPEVEAIVDAIGRKMGDLTARSGAGLAGDDWDEMFAWASTDAVDNLDDMGTAVGNVVTGLGKLIVAVDPLSDGFGGWLVDATQGFEDWADAVDDTDGFREFIAYVETNGPKVADASVAIASAVLDIVEAAAPLGGPVLEGVRAVAKAFGALADSDLGTPIMGGVMALSLLNRTLAMTASLSGTAASGGIFGGVNTVRGGIGQARTQVVGLTKDLKSMRGEYQRLGTAQAVVTSGLSATTGAAQRTRESLKTVGKAGAGVAALSVITTGAADSFGLTNTATLALAGSIAGPWGAAIGGGVGLMLDFNASLTGNTAASKAATESALALADAYLKTLDPLTGLATMGSTEMLWAQLPPGAAEEMAQLGVSAEAYISALTSGDAQAASLMWGELMAADMKGDLSEETGAAVMALAAGVQKSADAYESQKTAAEKSGQAGVDAARRQAEALGVTIAALQKLHDERIRGANAEVGFYAALDAGTKAVKENGATLDVTTEAGRANKSALLELAASWNDLNAAGESSPGAFQRARNALIDTAMQMGATKREAMDLADGILDIPDTKVAELKAYGFDTALLSAKELRAAIADLKSREIFVKTHFQSVYENQGKTGGGGKGRMSAPGEPRAAGGPIVGPGTGTSDDVPIMASNGEYMHRTAAVNHYGLRFMEDVNNLRFERPEGYATGGQVRKKKAKKKPQGPAQYLASENSEGDWMPSQFVPQFDAFAAALDDATAAADAQSAVVDALTSKQNDLATSIEQALKSDLFAGTSNGWSNPTGGPMATLQKDIENAQALNTARDALDDFLEGDALAAVLQGGLGNAQAMAGWSGVELENFEALFNERAAMASSTATAAGDAAYGAEVRAQTAILAQQQATQEALQATVDRIEAKADGWADRVGQSAAGGVTKGAAAGARAKKKGGRG